MAETPVAPNNKPVAFGVKPGREMADNRVNAEDQPASGKPKKPKIRKSAKRAIKRGMISEKAARRHLGDY